MPAGFFYMLKRVHAVLMPLLAPSVPNVPADV